MRMNADFLSATVRNGIGGHLTDMSDGAIDAGVRMGHVHLKVADLERALGFYCGVLGFHLIAIRGLCGVYLSWRVPSPYRVEYVGEQGRNCSSDRDHRAVSPGDRVPDPRGTG